MQRKTIATALLLFLTVATTNAADSARPPSSKISDGTITVGTSVERLRNLHREANCAVSVDYSDCTFTDPQGISYIAFGKQVTTVIATQDVTKSAISLPFGLKFGMPLGDIIRCLESSRTYWTLIPTLDGAALISQRDFPGEGGARYQIELSLKRGNLSEVRLATGSV